MAIKYFFLFIQKVNLSKKLRNHKRGIKVTIYCLKLFQKRNTTQRMMSYSDLKKDSAKRKREISEQEKENCFIEIQGEEKFMKYAMWCFPITAYIGNDFSLVI